jgi:hypothetical protein
MRFPCTAGWFVGKMAAFAALNYTRVFSSIFYLFIDYSVAAGVGPTAVGVRCALRAAMCLYEEY